jgi:hypothetical protein
VVRRGWSPGVEENSISRKTAERAGGRREKVCLNAVRDVAIAEDPKADGVIFVGTDLGVFASADSGATWVSLDYSLPTVPVVDLAVHERDDTLVAVTHGLSAFHLAIDSVRAAVGH